MNVKAGVASICLVSARIADVHLEHAYRGGQRKLSVGSCVVLASNGVVRFVCWWWSAHESAYSSDVLLYIFKVGLQSEYH